MKTGKKQENAEMIDTHGTVYTMNGPEAGVYAGCEGIKNTKMTKKS